MPCRPISKSSLEALPGSWNEYFTSIRESEFSYFDEAGNKLLHKRDEAIDPFLTDILRFFSVVAEKKPVFLILDNPVDDMFDPKKQISGSRLFGLAYKPSPALSYEMDDNTVGLRTKMTGAAKAIGFRIVDPTSTLCQSQRCPITNMGIPVYKDSDHLRSSYTREHATFIDVVFL